MTPEAFKAQETAAREQIELLRQGRGQIRATADFVSRVMSRADGVPPFRPGLRSWLREVGRCLLVPRAGFAVAALLLVALFGAVPQYLTWLRAYRLGIPSTTIHQARLQQRLWQKNFACATRLDRQSDNYAAVVGEQVTVVTWACPSGDVLVTVEPSTDEAARRSVWIPLDGPAPQSAGLPWAIREAFAAGGARRARKPKAPMVTVLCQKWRSDRFIKRRIQLANGRCFDEVINPLTGKVVKIQKAGCQRDC